MRLEDPHPLLVLLGAVVEHFEPEVRVHRRVVEPLLDVAVDAVRVGGRDVRERLQLPNAARHFQHLLRPANVRLDEIEQRDVEADVGRRVNHNLNILLDHLHPPRAQAHLQLGQIAVKHLDAALEMRISLAQQLENLQRHGNGSVNA